MPAPRPGEPTDGHPRRRRAEAAGRCAGSSSRSRLLGARPGVPGRPAAHTGPAVVGPELLLCPPRRRLLRTRAASSQSRFVLGSPPEEREKYFKNKRGSWVCLYGHSLLRLEIEPRRRPACHRTLQIVWGRVYTPFLKKNLMLQFPTNSRE